MPAFFLLLLAIYSLCFAVGVAGNCWVVARLTAQFSRNTHRPLCFIKNQHIYIYILALSVVDLMVLAMIPTVISYFVNGNWHFGYLMCKFFWIVENVNKLLSVAILTVMSFEQYAAVCRPFKWCHYRTRFSVLTALICCFAIVVLLLGPVIYYAGVETFQIMVDNVTVINKTSCSLEMPNHFVSTFIGYMFTGGFILPAGIMLVCYSALVRHVRAISARRISEENFGQLTSHHAPHRTHRLIIAIRRVVFFHFGCWTPFWLSVLWPLVVEGRNDSLITSKTVTVGRLLASCLPHVNCSFNWVFYSLLDRELRSFITEQRQEWDGSGSRLSQPNAFHGFLELLQNMSWRTFYFRKQEDVSNSIALIPPPQSKSVQEIVASKYENVYLMGVIQESLL